MLESTMWQGFCQFVGIPVPLGRRIWAGLTRAHWSEAVALREAFVSHEPVSILWGGKVVGAHRGDPEALATKIATPEVLLKVLVNCLVEKVLTRHDMRSCAGIILEWMAYNDPARQAWEAASAPRWMYGPVPDFSRWLTKAEHERQNKNV